MKYWLHRITGGDNAWSLAQALFKKGFISIGWCDFSYDINIDIIRGDESGFNKMFFDEWQQYPRNRWNLWRFVKGMQPGDIVVVPFSYSFIVCRILDNEVFTNESIDHNLLTDLDNTLVSRKENGYLYYSDGRLVDLGFYRRVELLSDKEIPRIKFADQKLYSRMKIRQTNADITNIGDSVDNALAAFASNRPINLRESILESSSSIVLDKIQALLNADNFEGLVDWYLQSLGARVEKPSKNGSPTEDGDADRVGYFDKIGFAVMVQVKKHGGITGDWAVNQIKAYKANHNFGDYATALWVISSGDDFSDNAKQLAGAEGVRLIDGKTFARMILETGLADLPL